MVARTDGLSSAMRRIAAQAPNMQHTLFVRGPAEHYVLANERPPWDDRGLRRQKVTVPTPRLEANVEMSALHRVDRHRTVLPACLAVPFSHGQV